MKGCLTALGIFAGLVLVGIVSCSIAYPEIHIRYRLKFDVKVDDTIRTGSGVVEVSYQIVPDYMNVNGALVGLNHIYGNAITIDLGEKGLLFAVFRMPSDSHYRLGDTALPAYGLETSNTPSKLKASLRQLQRKSGLVEVPIDAVPLLVCFRDINDPWSAEKVDPRNFSATFGKGVELIRVSLELTDDPISEMPANWPAWMKALKVGDNLGGAIISGHAPLGLQAAEFKGY
jgi:hypothetical protein